MSEARAPLAVTRRAQLLEVLQRLGTARVSDLTATLGVSAITIRRDIAQLADEGLVQRVHGGAAIVPPDHAVSTERAGSTLAKYGAGQRLGMLVPSLDYYWPEVVKGAQEAASELGMEIVLRGSSYDAADERPQLRRLVEQQHAEALIIAPRGDVPAAAATMEWLNETGVPTVLVERTARQGPYQLAMESVVTDHALGAAIAVRHLAKLGHQRIGAVISRESPTGPPVHRGWLESLSELGLDPAQTVDAWVPDCRSATWDRELSEVLDRCRATATTALLVLADAEAMALVQRWEDGGLTVPGDVSVIAYDDESAGLFSPPLTAIRPPRHSIGRAAVELAAARLAEPERPIHRVVLSPSLSERESASAPPARLDPDRSTRSTSGAGALGTNTPG